MESHQKAHLEAAIAKGYYHRSGDCLLWGGRIYRSQFLLFSAFSMVLPLATSLVSALNMGTWGTLAVLLALTSILHAGYYLAAHKITQYPGERLRFGDFFKGYHLTEPLVVNTLLSTAIAVLIMIPTYFVLEQSGFLTWYQEALKNPTELPEPPLFSPRESSVLSLNLIPFIYLQVGFSWAFPMILFFGANAFSALEYSRRLVGKRWWAQFMLLLTFVSFFITGSMLLGAVPGLANVLVFALFLLVPWLHCSLYAGFAHAVAMTTDEDENEETA